MVEESPEEIDSIRLLKEELEKENWLRCNKCRSWVLDGELDYCDKDLKCPLLIKLGN